MSRIKWWAPLLFALCYAAAGAPAAAQEPLPKADAPVLADNQMKVEADRLFYNDSTGAMEAEGNVLIWRRDSLWQTEHLYGNRQTGDYRLPGVLHWTDSVRPADMTLADAAYDGASQTAVFATAQGLVGNLYLHGEEGVYERAARRGHLARAMVTTPSAVAKVPDYRMEAEDIEFVDNEKMVAHNASFYIKNHRIFTLSTYKTSIRRDGNKSSFMSFIPRPLYRSHNGFGLRAHWRYPLNKRTEAFIRYVWFSRKGFKPDIGVQYFAPFGNFTLHYSKEESVVNDEAVWIEKRPELKFDSRSFYFGNSPIYFAFGGDWGNWREGSTKGSHAGWYAELSTSQLPLDSHWWWRPKVGYTRDYYGYDNSQRGNAYAGIHLQYDGPRWQFETGYVHNNYSGTTPYAFDRPDIIHRAYGGVKFQIDRLNAIGVKLTFDTSNGDLVYEDYTWYRDLHSFTATLTYRAQEDEIRLRIRAKDF